MTPGCGWRGPARRSLVMLAAVLSLTVQMATPVAAAAEPPIGGPAAATATPATPAAPPDASKAPASAPPVAPPAPAPTLACTTAPLADLSAEVLKSPRGSIMLTTEILPGHAESDVVYTQASGSPAVTEQLEFRAFLLWPGSELIASGARVLDVLSVRHPPGDMIQNPAFKSVTDTQNAYGLHLNVPDQQVWWPRQPRNLIVVACAKSGAKDTVAGWAWRPVSASTRNGAGLIAALLMALLYLAAGTWVWAKRRREAQDQAARTVVLPLRTTTVQPWAWWKCLDPVVMSSDMFDRASLSKLQILMFVLLVGFGATYSFVRTGTLSDLSPSVVFLLGIPALGSLGNQVGANRDRLSLDNWSWLVSYGVLPVNDRGQDVPRWTDLVMSEAELDLYKLQALTFSLIVGIAMVASGFSNLATFNVPPTLLEVLGLSQAVFVGGRFTKPATMGDLDDLLTELRKRAAEFRVAAKAAIDVDNTGKLTAEPDPAKPVKGAPVLTLADAHRLVPNAVARYDEVADQVKLLVEGMANRSVQSAILEDPTKL